MSIRKHFRKNLSPQIIMELYSSVFIQTTHRKSCVSCVPKHYLVLNLISPQPSFDLLSPSCIISFGHHCDHCRYRHRRRHHDERPKASLCSSSSGGPRPHDPHGRHGPSHCPSWSTSKLHHHPSQCSPHQAHHRHRASFRALNPIHRAGASSCWGRARGVREFRPAPLGRFVQVPIRFHKPTPRSLRTLSS